MRKIKDNLFDDIDKDLAKLGKVSRSYSDDDNVTITTDYSTYKENRSMLDGIMGDYGYEFYDLGGNGDKVMLTYNKVSDSRKVSDELEQNPYKHTTYVVYDLNRVARTFEYEDDAIDFAKRLFSKTKRDVEVVRFIKKGEGLDRTYEDEIIWSSYNQVSDSRNVKDDLDEDMKLWEERSKDEFGKVLKKIEKYCIDLWGLTNDYEVEGLEQSIISKYINTYALDGDRNYVARRVYNTLENFDMIDNMDDPHFMELVNEMLKLGGVNNISDSRRVKYDNKPISVYFVGIDSFGRLTFYSPDTDYFYMAVESANGSPNHEVRDFFHTLDNDNRDKKGNEKKVLDWDKTHGFVLKKKGEYFDSEPQGGSPINYKLVANVSDSRRVKDSDDEYLLQEIARQLEEGYHAGYEPQWDIDITVDDMDISEFDDYDQDLIYRDIAYVVKDGYDNYMGIETELSDGSIAFVDFVLNY